MNATEAELQTENRERLRAVDELLHRLLWGISLRKPANWTPELESIGALGLHAVKMAGENPDVLLGEIRSALDLPHSTLTSLVDRLERRGLMQRVINPRDRRSYGLELTAEGRRIKRAHDELDRELAGMLLSALDTEAERDEFARLAGKIAGRLTAED